MSFFVHCRVTIAFNTYIANIAKTKLSTGYNVSTVLCLSSHSCFCAEISRLKAFQCLIRRATGPLFIVMMRMNEIACDYCFLLSGRLRGWWTTSTSAQILARIWLSSSGSLTSLGSRTLPPTVSSSCASITPTRSFTNFLTTTSSPLNKKR